MADMLEKLLDVEKLASIVVSEAETEAARRTSAARAEQQRTSTELVKRKAAESAQALAQEREDIAAERERKNSAYREGLAAAPLDHAAFAREVRAQLEKGGA
jgi:hypothetical protein